MNSNVICLSVFGGVFGAALVAMRLRAALPQGHLSEVTKDTVKLAMGLVATMTALVLGLLVASTKASYDTQKNELTEMAGKIIYLDRLLVGYGPESAPARKLLRHAVERVIRRMWPDEKAGSVSPPDPTVGGTDTVTDAIYQLAPQTDAQRAAKSEAQQLIGEVGQMRWLLFEQEDSSISMPMLGIVICWVAMLFVSFGLFAPANGTAVSALLVAALSVSGAIFLILELDHPFDGVIHISSQHMRASLAHLGE